MPFEALTTGEIVAIGSTVVNGLLAYVMLNVKVELSQIKVWILENFERRAEKR